MNSIKVAKETCVTLINKRKDSEALLEMWTKKCDDSLKDYEKKYLEYERMVKQKPSYI